MTDEPPIPDDDAIARAARRALGRLADDGVTVAPWDDVRARGRRTQRMRAAVAIAAALLLVVGGAATVSAVHGKGNHVDVAGTDQRGSTTTTEAPTSTTAAPTTTTLPSAPPATAPAVGGTTPNSPVPDAQPADLAGTITVASTTWVADEPALVALTVQNVSGHPVALPTEINRSVGLYIDTYDATFFGSNPQAPLAPGEQRTFLATITPRPELIGAASISAGYLQSVVIRGGAIVMDAFPGVAPVAITVVPPGWSTGDPLDPARGSWTVALTADTTTVPSGGTATFHVTVTNTGDQPQQTNYYDTLSLTYTTGGAAGFDGHALGAATIAPGASQTFDVNLPIKLVGGMAHCFVGIGFPPADTNWTTPHVGVTSNSVDLTVVPAETTTTGP
jgi:hypothetical protein